MCADLTVMLLGKTGHGKSSTGNSILGEEVFDVSDSSQSYTKVVRRGTNRIDCRQISVIDTPGLYDTHDFDPTTEISKTTEYIRVGFNMSLHNRVDAFLLVLPYGTRHTNEEAAAVRALERTSLDRKLWDRCIVVFTSGSDFLLFRRKFRRPITFMDWCMNQGGSLGELLQRVEYRCLLFENLRSTDIQEREQRQNLFREVDYIRRHCGTFTKSDFEKVINKSKSFFSRIKSACTIL
ncbi:GTPase IMAP family member 4 [Aplysia californica]|uniref:GTPase IMAP family member 4 n=1 Tax=Aplysia californica TaxID=6500 RepID=A0ABM0JJY4_APLCA|nr:GTPase IMAP family member 4 [Aplysia californica]